MKFDDFFGKMSFLPSIKVCKHLKPAHLIALSTFSDQWKLAVQSSPVRAETEMDIEIEKENLEVTLKFEKDETEHLRISSTSEHFFGDDEITREKKIGMLRLLTHMFPPKYDTIIVSIGSGSPDFPFKLLSMLPRGKAFSISIHAKKPVENCDDLIEFLENVSSEDTLTLNIVAKNNEVVKKTDRIDGRDVFVKDARFIAGNTLSLMKKCKYVEFLLNQFTSQEINAFFRRWQRLENKASSVAFDISDDQVIDMDEVTRGLNAVDWNPAIRTRYSVYYTDEDTEDIHKTFQPKFLDLANGKDFRDFLNRAATVCLFDGILIFLMWEGSLAVEQHQWQTERLANFERQLEENKKEQERLEKEGSEEEAMKKVLEDIQMYSELIQKTKHTLTLFEPYIQN